VDESVLDLCSPNPSQSPSKASHQHGQINPTSDSNNYNHNNNNNNNITNNNNTNNSRNHNNNDQNNKNTNNNNNTIQVTTPESKSKSGSRIPVPLTVSPMIVEALDTGRRSTAATVTIIPALPPSSPTIPRNNHIENIQNNGSSNHNRNDNLEYDQKNNIESYEKRPQERLPPPPPQLEGGTDGSPRYIPLADIKALSSLSSNKADRQQLLQGEFRIKGTAISIRKFKITPEDGYLVLLNMIEDEGDELDLPVQVSSDFVTKHIQLSVEEYIKQQKPLRKDEKLALKEKCSMKFVHFTGYFRARSLMLDMDSPGEGPALVLMGFCDKSQ